MSRRGLSKKEIREWRDDYAEGLMNNSKSELVDELTDNMSDDQITDYAFECMDSLKTDEFFSVLYVLELDV